MANQLQMAGSPGKPLKFVPIYTSRFFQGLWSQRNPLRSGALGWQTEKYYGANNDCLIDGLNTEVSSRLTLIRRPGTSVYNNEDFPPVFSFYSFRLFSTRSEAIKVIIDTINTIYDGTGPDTQQAIYEKNFPEPARFQSVGNVLYFGDGDVEKKWIQSLNTWLPSTTFNLNDFFIDPGQNIQVFTDLALFRETSFFTIASTAATGTTLKVRYYSEGRGGNAIGIAGSVMSFSNLIVKTALNGAGVVGPLVQDIPVTPYQRTYTETGVQSVTDNILTVTVQFAGAFPVGNPDFMFPVGSRVSFNGAEDSPYGGGGVILTSSVDLGLFTATFTVVYRHPDYDSSTSPITDIVSFYGDRELTITYAAGAWVDTQDEGFACVGSSGTALTGIDTIEIGSNVLTATATTTFGAVLMPHTKVTFSGFVAADLLFLNGKSGWVYSCNTTTCLIVFEWTNLASTLTTGPGNIDSVDTQQDPVAITSLTISAGLLDVLAVNDYHVGDVVKFQGMVTATELNGLNFPVSFSNGSSFHCHVPFADRGVTAEGAATAQQQYGFLVIEAGKITLYQNSNPFSAGQTVQFSGFTHSSFLNGKVFTIDNTWDRRHYRGDYPDGTAKITHVEIVSNVCTVTAANQYTAGQYVTLVCDYPGFPTFAQIISTTAADFTIAFTTADADVNANGNSYLFYTTMTDLAGKIRTVPGTAATGTTGANSPFINGMGTNLAGGSTFEEGMEWVNRGSNLQNMGLAGPPRMPDVQLLPPAALPTPVNVWVASAYFAEEGAGAITVVDNTVGPYIQEVTQAGVTGVSEPVWNTTPGGTTTDNTVVWTNRGIVGRVQNTAYQLGDRVAVTYYVQVITGYAGYPGPGYGYPGYSGDSGYGGNYSPGGITPGSPIYSTIGPFSSYFTCTTAGTTIDAPSTAVQWSNAPGQFVTDGSVTWQNTGSLKLWPGANIDLTTSGSGSIVDSNNNIQRVSTSGVTGTTEPTWATDQGVTTTDGSITWINDGPYAGGASVTPDTVPGKWYYGYAFKNSFTNEVSNMSPFSQPVVPIPGAAISVSGEDSEDAQFDTIVIYRTLQGGSTFFWIAEISSLNVVGGKWNYLDVSPDPPAPGSTMNLLTTAAVNLENTPPPSGTTNWAFHLNRLWGSVGNIVVFSNPPGFSTGSNYTQFPPSNYFTFSSKVNRLWPIGSSGLLVFTVSDIYIITGTTTSTFNPAPFLKGVGLLNYSAFTVMGSVICMFTSDGQLISLDPNSGVTEIGFPIGDLINDSFDPATSFVSWHVSGSKDKALYLSNGSTGWHRLSPTAAPESGLMWSPFAEILGGISAVQSIEVSPGVFRLLIGS